MIAWSLLLTLTAPAETAPAPAPAPEAPAPIDLSASSTATPATTDAGTEEDAPAPDDPADTASPGDAAAEEARRAALADVGLDEPAPTPTTPPNPSEAGTGSSLAQPLEPPPSAVEPEPPVDAVSASPPPPAPRGGRVAKKRRTTAKTPPRELQWRAEVHAGVGTLAVFHPSYQMFDSSDRELTMTRLSLVADRRFGGRVFLGGGLAYAGGATGSGGFLATADTTLRVDEPIAFGRLSVFPVEAIDLYANLGVGPSILRTTFNASSAALGSAEQKSVTFVGEALLGTMLYLPQRWLPRGGSSRVTGGLDLHLGYSLRGAVRVQPEPTLDDDPIATAPADLGGLNVRGLTWNLGIFVRFQ